MTDNDLIPGPAAAEDALRLRSRRRTQALAVALLVALVAGPFVGYEIGSRVTADTGVTTGVAGDDDGAVADRSAADIDRTDIAEESMPTSAGAGTSMAIDHAYASGYGEPMERVGVVTIGGTTIRLFRVEHPAPDFGNPLWEPPAGCFPTGSVVAQASTDAMVATAAAEVHGVDDVEATVVLVGMAEGDPHWLAVGTTTARSVTVQFADGPAVPAQLVDGVFTASTPASSGDRGAVEPSATVVADGTETVIRPWHTDRGEEFYRQCEPPPPALPEPGEQPDDPDAARAEIEEVYALGYGGGRNGGDQLTAFQDPEYLAPVLEELDQNPMFDQYRGTLSAVVTEVVFDAPDHAWLFFDLEPVLTQVIGEAVRTDSGWKVATATICNDVARAGTSCP